MDARVHVTFDDTTTEIIAMIAAKEKRAKSEVVRRIVENWFERYEDEYWCEIAALSDSKETIPAEEVWKCIV